MVSLTFFNHEHLRSRSCFVEPLTPPFKCLIEHCEPTMKLLNSFVEILNSTVAWKERQRFEKELLVLEENIRSTVYLM